MHEQTKARDERLQGKQRLAEGTVVVAVVAGEGNKALFRELGCQAIVDGGQSMNPSAAQLLEAVDSLGADEVVVLPNNGNVVLTAEQAAGMSARHIAVVPSTSIPVGLAAMVAFDAEGDAVGNARRHGRGHRGRPLRRGHARRARLGAGRRRGPQGPGDGHRRRQAGGRRGRPGDRLPRRAAARSPARTPSSSPCSRRSTARASTRETPGGARRARPCPTPRSASTRAASRCTRSSPAPSEGGGGERAPDPGEHGDRAGLHRGPVRGLLRPPRDLHGAAQGALRRRDVPRRRRHGLQGVLREARGRPRCCRPRRSRPWGSSPPSTPRRARSTSTSSPCTSRGR